MTSKRDGEWSGYKIHEASKGWVVEEWSRIQGEVTGRRWLIPYGTLGLQKGVDLDASWNETMTTGERLFHERSETGRLLCKGWKVF